jgi:hypothetical protein
MDPIMTVEFQARGENTECMEECVPLHSPEELMAYIAPGGGCESIPDGVNEIQMVFLPGQHRDSSVHIADTTTSLQIGIVIISGPLSEVAETANMLLDRAGRNEISSAFLSAIGCK